MAEYDVIIVGGGIGGLYAAWRLMRTTNLKIAVFEALERFGGRYHTVMMPGGFTADLGAMRFLPLSHPLLYKLTRDLGLDIERFYVKSEVEGNTHSEYYKNTHVKNANELIKLYSVSKEELPYFMPSPVAEAFTIPSDRNFFEAKCHKTGMFAKDMSEALYKSLPMNPGILNECGDDQYPLTLSMGERLAWTNLFQSATDTHPLAGYHCVKGGMETVITKLVSDLKNSPRVKLHTSTRVTAIKEGREWFSIGTEDAPSTNVSAKKLILACNGRGAEYITWNSPHIRTTQLRRLLDRVRATKGIKVFLTYEKPWWEEKGLICGNLQTDLTVKEVTAFGSRGKSSEYATLLAAFTYNHPEIFWGMNQPHYPRFINRVGDVPDELVPSEILVNYVQKQLGKIFDKRDMPMPVCAVAKMWLAKDTMAAHYEAGIGEDSYQLQWAGLKPFPDADVFMTGDTFNACTPAGTYIGWSEGVLLNSERIVTNYFNVVPYTTGLELENRRPKSKL